jgi:hypothetical protein
MLASPLPVIGPLSRRDREGAVIDAALFFIPSKVGALRSTSAEARILYGKLDDLRRPSGAYASITEDMIGTGTPPSRSITPPGFQGGVAGQARGHLLGNQLGGSGTDVRNIVTLQQNPANMPVMRSFENQIRKAVEAKQVVNAAFIPSYKGNNLIPRGVTIMAEGSGGFHLGVTVLNPPGF